MKGVITQVEIQGVTVNSLLSDNGKKPHDLIKEYVERKFNSNAYDVCFDKAFELGLTCGTETYDSAMAHILNALNISEHEIKVMLISNGVAIE